MHGGVIDEPFYPNIAIKKEIRPSVAGFGSSISTYGGFFEISVAINQQRRERMTFRLLRLNDFESNSDMGLHGWILSRCGNWGWKYKIGKLHTAPCRRLVTERTPSSSSNRACVSRWWAIHSWQTWLRDEYVCLEDYQKISNKRTPRPRQPLKSLWSFSWISHTYHHLRARVTTFEPIPT